MVSKMRTVIETSLFISLLYNLLLQSRLVIDRIFEKIVCFRRRKLKKKKKISEQKILSRNPISPLKS